MPSITVAEKKKAIQSLVTDTVSARIIQLRLDTNKHWLDIVEALFDSYDIEGSNRTVRDIMANREALQIALIGEYGDVNPCVQHEARLQPVTTIVAERSVTDPLGLQYIATSGDDYEDIWDDACEGISYKLPTKMLTITTEPLPRDKPGSCSLMDPSEYAIDTITVDVDQHIPEDCTTNRKFRERARGIRDDIRKLESALTDATRNCRTDAALVKSVPALKKYIMPTSEVDVNSLLDNARNG